jgi:hypothetical protein
LHWCRGRLSANRAASVCAAASDDRAVTHSKMHCWLPSVENSQGLP